MVLFSLGDTHCLRLCVWVVCLGYCGGVCIGFEFGVGLPGWGMGWTLFSGSVLDMFWFLLGLWVLELVCGFH